MTRIYVVHEYGANAHYKALEKYCKNNNITVDYFEFSIFRQIVKSIIKSDMNLLKKVCYNLRFLVGSFLFSGKNRKIILGVAPFDLRLLLLVILFRNDDIYIHNSWPNWEGDNFPKKTLQRLSSLLWKYVINRKIKGFFAVSSITAKGVREYFNLVDKPNISVVYHSLDKQQFLNIKRVKAKKYSKNIVFIGRVCKEKGIDDILHLSKVLKDYKFHILGDGANLNEYKNNASDNVIFYGHLTDRKDINKIIDKCSVILLPSKRTKIWEEAFGLSIIESMARGVVPIATNHAGPIEIIEDTVDGCIFFEDHFTSMVVDFFDSLTFDKWKSMSVSAYKSAGYYTDDNLSHKWEELLGAQ